MDHVYIVIATEGSWDDRAEWVAGVYLTGPEAEEAARSARWLAAKNRAAWQEWSARTRDMVRKTRHVPNLDEAEPEPQAPEADTFAVIEVPVGQHGKWSAF